MDIGFKKNGLTINGKNFNPLSFSIGGHSVSSDEISSAQVDPFEMLAELANIKTMTEKSEQVGALRNLVK